MEKTLFRRNFSFKFGSLLKKIINTITLLKYNLEKVIRLRFYEENKFWTAP